MYDYFLQYVVDKLLTNDFLTILQPSNANFEFLSQSIDYQ